MNGFNLDFTFPLSYIPSVAWEVEYTAEFGAWWDTLKAGEQEDVDAVVRVLEEKGPGLSRPYSDVIVTSRHANMKELRIQHRGRPYRVLYAFDPRRKAMLLLGGAKAGKSRWYAEAVPRADKLYDQHLRQLRKEGLI